MLERFAKTRPGQLLVTATLDAVDTVRGRRDPLTPPRRMMFVGAGYYRATGEEFKRYFVELGGLKPSDDVLDVGCGIGRMAVPLAGWLTGHYEGFDVVPSGIAWCEREIAPRYPNFRFQVADLFNKKYNPGGRQTAESYRFPYNDDSFDFVFLTSVFTHLLPNAVANYVGEIRRVLRDGGTVFSTFFLIDDESLAGIRAGTSKFAFEEADGCWTTNRPVPESAVGYAPESAVGYAPRWVDELHEHHGLSIQRLDSGFWPGRDGLSLQDIVIAR